MHVGIRLARSTFGVFVDSEQRHALVVKLNKTAMTMIMGTVLGRGWHASGLVRVRLHHGAW
jgi:hypothetical protein